MKQKKVKNKRLLLTTIISSELSIISVLLISICAIIFDFRYKEFFTSKDTATFWYGALLITGLIVGTVVFLTSFLSLIMSLSKYNDARLTNKKDK